MSNPSGPGIQPGDVLMNKYRVDHVLGAGGMGAVLAATHLTLGHVVAIKVMLPGAAGDVHHQRFLREARASLRLRSEHVARVLDVGTLENGAPYMLMELLEGRDLMAEIKERGGLGVAEAVDYVLQACHAVAEAHAAGIVHRDLKPANLFLTQTPEGTPRIKVLDFGISKVADDMVALTSDQQALGSPLYMSPEQMRSSRDVDARTDVWAIGVTLYQLLAGQTPFPGRTVQEVCSRVFMDAPVPLSTYRSDLPSGFEAVLFQCLEKDRTRRFASVGALSAALAPYGPVDAIKSAERVAAVLGEHVAPARPTATLWPTALPQGDQDTAASSPATASGATPPGVLAPVPIQSSTGPALTTGSALVTSSAAANRKRRTGVVAAVTAGLVVAVVATVGLVRGRALVEGASASTPTAAAPAISGAPSASAAAEVAPAASLEERPAPSVTAAAPAAPAAPAASSAASATPIATSSATVAPKQTRPPVHVARPVPAPVRPTKNVYDP